MDALRACNDSFFLPRQVSPSLEIMPASDGQENASVPRGVSQPSKSGSSTSQAPPGPLSSDAGQSKRPVPKARYEPASVSRPHQARAGHVLPRVAVVCADTSSAPSPPDEKWVWNEWAVPQCPQPCFPPCMVCSSRRSLSLSTIAILNSVKKAVESNSRRGSRSIGMLPFTLNSESLDRAHPPRGEARGSPEG